MKKRMRNFKIRKDYSRGGYAEGGYTDQQIIDAITGYGINLTGTYSDEDLARLQKAATNYGITDEQLNRVLYPTTEPEKDVDVAGSGSLEPKSDYVPTAPPGYYYDPVSKQYVPITSTYTPTNVQTDTSTAPVVSAVEDIQAVTPESIQTQEVEKLSIPAGITSPENIQQLDAYEDIPPPEGISAPMLEAAQAQVRQAVMNGTVNIAEYNAALVTALNQMTAAEGTARTVTVDEIKQLTAPATAATVQLTGAETASVADYIVSDGAFVPQVTGTQVNISPTAEAEAQTREAILGEAATGEAAQILNVINFDAAQRRAYTGTAAQGAAQEMLAALGNLPPEIVAALAENPQAVQAMLDENYAGSEVQGVVAALPEEALMSAQIENLLGSLESGKVPTWAKPAVDAVTEAMGQRGLDVSTVARDSLFNAIIQSAFPIAQDNARALQERSAQNLNNRQQAAMQSSSQGMQLRLQNLANRQTAASQTAQLAQNMAQFNASQRQQATMFSAQQAQDVRLQNLQNRQRTAEMNAQNQQAMEAMNLSNAQQMELANLEALNAAGSENMSAENLARLEEYRTAAQFLTKNAEFKQEMEMANMTSEQQMRLANLSALNQAGADNLSAAQQTELANLQARMEQNLAQARIAQEMGVAQLNVDQQRAVLNAQTVANIDLNKFNAAQQVQLANSQFMQSVTLANFNAEQQAILQNATAMASMDLATVDQRTKLAITNAQNFLQMDLANLSNEQQASVLNQQMNQQRLLSNQSAENASRQFNAASAMEVEKFMTSLATQIEQFNAQQANAMSQFNATETNRTSALNAGNQIDVMKFEQQMATQIAQFNEQVDLQRDQWNASNAQAIEQSNMEWRRQANTIDTAAINAANAAATQFSYQLTAAETSAVWQELRDAASYVRQAYENEQQRKTTLYATALANEAGVTATGSGSTQALITLIQSLFA